MSGVFVRQLDAPPIDRREILRYAGVRGEAPELLPILEECLSEIEGELSYRVVYTERPLRADHPYGFADRLSGCGHVVIFAATVGVAPDRLMIRCGSREPVRALLYQAIGTERVEALCDAFCAELKGRASRPRFSPGYGDCPLSLQREIIEILGAPARIGLTVNESLLLSPTKSVTAIVGVE
ncbi:MAG: hypothetical protein IKA76_01325 [Clostridia bacterium]|nr:hypothetical protein [Clostridia bacterium]